MGKRSLKASSEGQTAARKAFERTQWTQEQLAFEVGLNTRQSVWKFLTGRPVERHVFIELCFQLSLDWQEIADLPPAPGAVQPTAEPPSAVQNSQQTDVLESAADAWVAKLRAYLQPNITKQCGVLQSSLDVGRPLSLEQLYTPIRIVPHLRHQQWLDVADLQPNQADKNRFRLAHAHPESVDAMAIISKTPKVMMLGKPGAGKTTFLKHVANQCITGQYCPKCIPVFISLRYGFDSYGEEGALSPSNYLLKYLVGLCQGIGCSEPQLHILLQQGRFLLLLDGLDEVSTDNQHEVLAEIQNFTQTYPNNPCLITSRLTSRSAYLPGFFDVEVDDFSRSQIQTFVEQWFAGNLPNSEMAHSKTKQFLEALDTDENQPLKELVATPILLSLLCSVFLTRSDFPRQRAKLYQAGVDILLQRWDQARGIQRDRVYQDLSVGEKLKLLGKIAATTFEKGQYFFEKSELLDIIADYLQELDASKHDLDLEELYQQSEVILQAIQLQHGLIVERAKEVYSFSHLTFQEYLTARKVLYQVTPESLTQTIQNLAARTLDSSWHEVLRLTANMMTKAESLLGQMHNVIQASLVDDAACQKCLQAIAQKAETLQVDYQPAAVRAFYLTLFSDRDLRLATALDSSFGRVLASELALDLALARAFEMALELVQMPTLETMLNLTFALELDQKFTLHPVLQTAFTELKEQLPELDEDSEPLATWWSNQGTSWLQTFETILLEHRQIGHLRQLTPKQKWRLQEYTQLNLFLVDCWYESHTPPEFDHSFPEKLLQPA